MLVEYAVWMVDPSNTDLERQVRFWIKKKQSPGVQASDRRAALCEFPNGKRHPHQYLIPNRPLELATSDRYRVAG